MKSICALALVVCIVAAAACAGRPAPSAPAGAAGKPAFERALDQGLLFLARGEYGKAAASFRTAAEARPDSAKARNFLGLCYFHDKDYALAREQFEKAIAADASFATAYNNLAGVCSIKNEFARAEELYKKALALSPDMVSANYNLGVLLCNLGRAKEGFGFISRGIALDPDYLEKNAEMTAAFNARSFDMKEAYFAYARAYAAAGDVGKAVAFLGKARDAGFKDWTRILRDAEFGKVLSDPRIASFLKEPAASN
ncbi:MAG TPA: tetratricopeptide repeat protein [Candidatus Aminicenantes bacterium]|nr:tetratricopeptide repeat protein [Candidatus Aminicenantes bacterium]HRY65610.1 tetratricopeptide repeat protein [Candidatus Aminicenantes bacterium]HRZ72502.1 tetratricopeptide repeat protein [Candidatus Aminicenantes bacterium]